VNSRPSAQGARKVRVKTIANERQLRYRTGWRNGAPWWTSSRRPYRLRARANTSNEGNRELAKQFAPYAYKDALISDDRYNGGGFIPDRMIELLAREPLNYWKRRGLEPQATPLLSHVGPKAMLINGLSSSGGDAFPYYFRKLALGR
jgi:tricorn protease